MPASSSSRCSIAARRWRERRTSTFRRWSSHCRSASASDTTRGVTPSTSTFMFTGTRVSSSLRRNSISIIVAGSTAAAARLEHDAHVLGQFVAHVGEQRQLALVEQIGELLDQPRLLHAIGDFGDDGDPAAAARLLLHPAGAQAEGAAPGAIGLDDRGLIVDDDAAGRKVGPRHECVSASVSGFGWAIR